MNPIVRLIGISVLSLVATACSKSEAPKPPADDKPPAAEASAAPSAASSAAAAPSAAPAEGSATGLKIAYSDWPGWIAWDIAVQKGWFKEAGVDVELQWLDYVPSMDAFSAGKVDAVCMTNGDALVTGAAGGKSISILVN